MDDSINLKSIVFKHDSHNLFSDLTVNFPNNKISVVYGKSGSGKTTLLNIILGLLKPDKGSVKINNNNLNDYNLNVHISAEISLTIVPEFSMPKFG